MVYLELSEDNPIFLDPSFKYYGLKNNTSNAEEIMSNLEHQYDLTDAMLDLYDVSKEIESDFGSIDIIDVFQQYEIQEQDISDTLTHDVPSGKVQIYTALPSDKSDVITISLRDTAIYLKKSCFLYAKDLTIEYEFTETSSEMMYDMYGYDSIDDLTGNLGPYESYAQIYGVVKVDGNKVANGNSSTLGKKEILKIDVASNGSTASFEKELTFGALYSIVFDYQIISPHEIAASYAKLP